jgi:hypothetical protein
VVRLCSSCSDYGEVWAQVAMALRSVDRLDGWVENGQRDERDEIGET